MYFEQVHHGHYFSIMNYNETFSNAVEVIFFRNPIVDIVSIHIEFIIKSPLIGVGSLFKSFYMPHIICVGKNPRLVYTHRTELQIH